MKSLSFKVLLTTVVFSTGTAVAVTHTEHAYNSVLNGIELNNACLTKDSVQTIQPLTVCEIKKEVVINDGINSTTDFICVKWSAQKLSYPRKYTTQECAELSVGEGDMSCKRYETKTHIMPQTIMIRKWTENKDYNNYPGSVVKFTFPHCK